MFFQSNKDLEDFKDGLTRRNCSANLFEESPNGEKSYKSVQIIQIFVRFV